MLYIYRMTEIYLKNTNRYQGRDRQQYSNNSVLQYSTFKQGIDYPDIKSTGKQ